MKYFSLFVGLWVVVTTREVHGQTRLLLSTVIPGTEAVQLVPNGDFQQQGRAENGRYPNPTGWSRQAEMFVGPGSNIMPVNGSSVAFAEVRAGGAPAGLYTRAIHLKANTAYVLSAYLWNFGDAGNRVTTVIDLADAYREPQLTLVPGHANADQGYFVYRNFNTAETGADVTLRVFYDGLTGSGTTPAHAPLGAQWDNVAITRAADFQAPRPADSGANLRPLVTITAPTEGEKLAISSPPVVLPITAIASDLDGTIARVEFFANEARIGETTSSPYGLIWSNVTSGTYELTAIATDNDGDSTLSAPVAFEVEVTAPRSVELQIAPAGPNVELSWPTSATAAALLSVRLLSPESDWEAVTNKPTVRSNVNVVTVAGGEAREFFQLGDDVDATTLDRKLLMGYQGWFACPGDGSPVNRWVHWFRHQMPDASHATVDFWPDVSEMDDDELFATDMTLPDGSPAKVFSSYNRKTTVRHFKWMKDNGLDGVFLQRFSSTLSSGSMFAFRNEVAANVRRGAEAYGRVFAMMYDISGQSGDTLISTLTNDWTYLTETMHLTDSPRYLRHNGKPVIAIWGFGFKDRPGTSQDALTVINWFKNAGCTVMGGVPTYWRTLRNDSQTDPAWKAAYRAFDVISPWAVGRYGSISKADEFKRNLIIPDLAETQALGIDYMPVIFPGFSWYNLKGGPLNQIPRAGGRFYWRQAFNAVDAGCTMIYGAMFDEVDEGTAMFKMAPTPAELPAQGRFVPLDIDGQALPSDWYLRLAGEATKMLRGRIPVSSTIPITPP